MGKPLFFTCWALEKLRKINTTSMKNLGKFAMGKKRPQNALKNGFGKVLGSIWEGSGRDRDVSCALLGASGPYFWHSKTNFFKALVQDRLQEAFWIDFGSILGGFGEGLGGSGEGFGRIWKLLATI